MLLNEVVVRILLTVEPFRYGHAANFNLQPGFINENGTRRYPATALVCNFSKPTPKKPSLLKHDEVVTLFHGQYNISSSAAVKFG